MKASEMESKSEVRACAGCGKPYSEEMFYGCNRNRCKECHKDMIRLRHRANPSFESERAKSPHSRAKSDARAERWKTDHPEGYRATKMTHNAVRSGVLTRGPCDGCGTDKNVCAFHDDYADPLVVNWRCRRCQGAM